MTTREGAITLGLSVSILASLIVAAIALERDSFAEYLIGLGIDQVFNDRLHEIPVTLWNELLSGTRRHFKVLGMANHGYIHSSAERAATKAALTAALGRDDVRVEFLWLNPETDSAKQRQQEERQRGLRRDTCAAIIWFWEFREGLAPTKRERLSLREYICLPTCGITWADNQIIVTHYLTGELNQRAPGVVLDATQPVLRRVASVVEPRSPDPPELARTYIENYQEVASDSWSRPIDEGRMPAIRALYDEEEDKGSEADLR